MKKVIIVGAGPGGLTTGMLLASRGYQVDIFEKQSYIGGRTSSFTQDGFRFDLGPTFLMMDYVLKQMFELSGRRLTDYMTLQEIDPLYRLVFEGGKEFYPTRDEKQMKEQLERVFPGSYPGYLKFLEKEKKKFDTLIPCLSIPYLSWTSYFKKQFLRSITKLDAQYSLINKLGQYFDEEELRIAFTFQAKYLGMSPWECPGTFSIISYIEHAGGIYHVMGGLNQIATGMAKVIEEEGGNIHLSSGVKEIIVDNKRAIGVLLENGEQIMADDVVINADFAHAMTHLIAAKHRVKYSDQKLRQKKYSCSTFMVYLGLDKVYDLPHHTIVFAKSYKKNVDEISKEKVLSDDPSVYIQNASVTDPNLAPSGKSALYVLVPVANNSSSIDWDNETPVFRERVLDILEKKAGLTDIRQHIESERVISPSNWEQDIHVYNGATFNLAHNLTQMLGFRPHNQFEELDHCYLVGGGTHPGSGLPTIFESARISTELILTSYGETLESLPEIREYPTRATQKRA